MSVALQLRRLIFRRVVAVERRVHVLELDHDMALKRLALQHARLAAARQKHRPVLLERHRRDVRVVLVFHRVQHGDMGNPVSRHLFLLSAKSLGRSRADWSNPTPAGPFFPAIPASRRIDRVNTHGTPYYGIPQCLPSSTDPGTLL
ncbi:hypothetical protein PSP6_50279 [Paraburkholderia tropica]|nr:hypothetical protein PSP6_50279 [Paraburkholderia tropica]